MATVTLPGSGANFVKITTGTDDQKVLQTAIKNLFNAAGPNITAVTVPSGSGATSGFFNLVFNAGSKATDLTAGANVQAIIDNGTGADTLTGGKSTTVLVGDAKGDLFKTSASGIATVFGGAGADTVDVSGKAVTYLEGGKNVVNLAGGDSVSLKGTGKGSADTVNITAGKNTVLSAYEATVDIKATKGSETLTLAAGSKVSISGSHDTVTLSSSGSTVTISGSSDSVKISGSNKVTVGAKSSDTISLGKNSTISLGASDTLNLSGSKAAAVVTASGSATIIGGTSTGTLKFTGAANAKDSVQAGHGSATLTAGKGASDLFVAGSGTNYLFTHSASGGGHDTFVGGSKSDTMVGAGTDKTHTDLFKFESSLKGGTHTITNFTSGKDTIDLVGYSKAQIDTAISKGAATFNAKTGTETITLSDHTKITVSGLHSALTKADFTGS